jgi:hypothetical protein
VLKQGESRLILKKVLASLSASCFPSAEVNIKNLYSLQKNLVGRYLSHVYLVGNKCTHTVLNKEITTLDIEVLNSDCRWPLLIIHCM